MSDTTTMTNVCTHPEEALRRVIDDGDDDNLTEKQIELLTLLRCDIDHGKEWPVELFEQTLGIKRDTREFGLAVSSIGRRVEPDGYRLTSRGKHGLFYFVEDLRRTHAIMAKFEKDAWRLVHRSVRFGNGVITNHAGKLSESDVRKIEKRAEIQAMRLITVRSMRAVAVKSNR